jgi:Polysaccharide deacetylase
VRANELGEIPVIMYHQIRRDGGGDFDLTPEEFRRELEQLYREGYRPIRAIDLVRGRIDVPAGKSPVVMTFDDSTKEQLAYDGAGRIKADTAIGILLDFARTHPGFEPAGTFYVNREPFAGVAEGPKMLRWLVANGFELGNHTHDHVPFNQKDAVGVQQALVRGRRIITRAVPQAQVRTLALPLGVLPEPPSLARAGRWDGESYRHDGVFLVGAEPAPSPFSRSWKPFAIPRIRTGPWRGGEPDYASGFWLDTLRRNPDSRYVSDGNPTTISFPRARMPELRPALRDRANPY